MEYLNWFSDHWVFVLTLAIVISGTITIPKIMAFLILGNR